MACRGIYFRRITPSPYYLILLVLLQAMLSLDLAVALAVKKNDVLAGTGFLSVFINGAMAPRPTRRRLNISYSTQSPVDNDVSELKNDEAAIYRISRVPRPTMPVRPRSTVAPRDDGTKYYPINHKFLSHRHHTLETLVDDLGSPGEITSKFSSKSDRSPFFTGRKIANKTLIKPAKPINQKVIGVSVTSSVESTPYKIRVEHNNPADYSVITRRPSVVATTTITYPTYNKLSTTRPFVKAMDPAATFTPPATDSTTLSSVYVTEEIANIVSESNKSQFSIEERQPRTGLQGQKFTLPAPKKSHQTISADTEQQLDIKDSVASGSNPYEQSYVLTDHNYEAKEVNQELPEIRVPFLKEGRKTGRYFEDSSFNQAKNIYSGQDDPEKSFLTPKLYDEPEKIFGEPSKIYSEPAKVYSEPAKVYGEPAKIYGEPSKIYSEPAKIYSEPAKVYGEPAKVYGEPAQIYSEPAKVYGEPAKIYGNDGQPIEEMNEKNYEVDESLSVETNGNVHGPQPALTETTNVDDDGRKVGYVVEGRNYRKYRVEERTADGFIVGEYGVVSHDDGSLRGVRYTADGTINPRLIYDALMKFLSL